MEDVTGVDLDPLHVSARAVSRHHAQARPANPESLGARAEVILVQPTGQVLSLVRMRGQSAQVAESYKNCALSVEAVQSMTLSPQASTSGAIQFGVHKVEK